MNSQKARTPAFVRSTADTLITWLTALAVRRIAPTSGPPRASTYERDDFREDLDVTLAVRQGKLVLQGPSVRLVIVDERMSGCPAPVAQRLLFQQIVPLQEEFSIDQRPPEMAT